MTPALHPSAPLFAVSRHRLSTDGVGVTTLVAFHGCPLRCRYCLNSQCWDPECIWRWMSPEDLVAELMKDNLYFLATGGGVCFGGGEPLLRAAFIDDFARLRPPLWNISIETSLHVDPSLLELVIPHVSHYFVDVKDLNPDIYRQYTGHDIDPLLTNLQLLADRGLQERITVRLPLIKDYNTDADRQHSRLQLEQMGFTRFDLFEYVTRV